MKKKMLIISLVLVSFLVINACSGGSKSSTSPGGGTDLGVISTLSGDQTQLILTVHSGDEPFFTHLRFFGVNSCYRQYEEYVDTRTDLGDGWWRLTFDIHSTSFQLSEQYRFGFLNNGQFSPFDPPDETWLDAGLCTIEATGVVLWEDAFAFAEYIGNEGNCRDLNVTVSGTPTRVTLAFNNGSSLDPQYTTMQLSDPNPTDLPVYVLEATIVNGDGNGQWEIIFDIPSEADVATRWMFGFVDTSTDKWISPTGATISSSIVVCYYNSFAFNEYSSCN